MLKSCLKPSLNLPKVLVSTQKECICFILSLFEDMPYSFYQCEIQKYITFNSQLLNVLTESEML